MNFLAAPPGARGHFSHVGGSNSKVEFYAEVVYDSHCVGANGILWGVRRLRKFAMCQFVLKVIAQGYTPMGGKRVEEDMRVKRQLKKRLSKLLFLN